MATFLPLQNGATAEGVGPGIQLIQIGNVTGGETGFTAIKQPILGTGFTLFTTPQGQQIIGNPFQSVQPMSTDPNHLALNAGNFLTTIPQQPGGQIFVPNPPITVPMATTIPTVPIATAVPTATTASTVTAPPTSQPRKRSRKQNMSTVVHLPQANSVTSTAASRRKSRKVGKGNRAVRQEEMDDSDDDDQPLVIAQPRSSKRKRKSPVRTTMADLYGEPEFTETYYFEETDDEEQEHLTNNVLHLMKERQRRRDMGELFRDLRKCVIVPGVHSDKTSRNDMLKLSYRVVVRLKKAGDQLRMARDSLRGTNRSQRERLAELLNVDCPPIEYESEEEELIEQVGGYQSSSSAPDNDDDDGSVGWLSGIEISDNDDDDEMGSEVKHESKEEEEEVDVKVELPEDEEEEEEEENVRIKEEATSDGEQDDESSNNNVQDKSASIGDHLKTYLKVRVKLDPDNDPSTSETTSNKQCEKEAPSSSRQHIRPSSIQRTRDKEDELVDVDFEYDRYARVKLEPRSPVRRALFGSVGKDASPANQRTVEESSSHECATTTGEQDDDELAISLGVTDHIDDCMEDGLTNKEVS